MLTIQPLQALSHSLLHTCIDCRHAQWVKVEQHVYPTPFPLFKDKLGKLVSTFASYRLAIHKTLDITYKVNKSHHIPRPEGGKKWISYHCPTILKVPPSFTGLKTNGASPPRRTQTSSSVRKAGVPMPKCPCSFTKDLRPLSASSP